MNTAHVYPGSAPFSQQLSRSASVGDMLETPLVPPVTRALPADFRSRHMYLAIESSTATDRTVDEYRYYARALGRTLLESNNQVSKTSSFRSSLKPPHNIRL